jgi:hypothetical protein
MRPSGAESGAGASAVELPTMTLRERAPSAQQGRSSSPVSGVRARSFPQ